MADPLSIAGGVAGVISLEIQVTQPLVDVYNSYTHQDSELRSITERLEDLMETFQLEERNPIETSIVNCKEQIQELQEECQTSESRRASRVSRSRVSTVSLLERSEPNSELRSLSDHPL